VKDHLQSSLQDETGAIAVKWVVLTAGVITLGIAVWRVFI
jgi:hypothetical protein